jgi:hypothetical protein
MSLQAHRTVFYDGIVNEVEAQHGGYYYGEKDTTGNTERRTIQTL